MTGKLDFDKWGQAKYRGITIMRAIDGGAGRNLTSLFCNAIGNESKQPESYYYYTFLLSWDSGPVASLETLTKILDGFLDTAK